MVTPPPSTSTRAQPALGERGADRARGDPAVGGGQRAPPRRPRARAVAGLDHEPPRAVGGEHPGVVGQPAARVDHHPRRARARRPAARSAAGRRRARCARRPPPRRRARGSGAGGAARRARRSSAASPLTRGDAAVERLADLGEEVGRTAAVGGERRVERPGGARLGRPVRRAARRAGPRGARAAPTRPRPSPRRAASSTRPSASRPSRRRVQHCMTLALAGASVKAAAHGSRPPAGRRRRAEGGEEAVAEGLHRPDRRVRRPGSARASSPSRRARARVPAAPMTWIGTSRPGRVAGDEGAPAGGRRGRRSAARSAGAALGEAPTTRQRVVERAAVLLAHPVVVAPDHLGRVAGGRRRGRRPGRRRAPPRAGAAGSASRARARR